MNDGCAVIVQEPTLSVYIYAGRMLLRTEMDQACGPIALSSTTRTLCYDMHTRNKIITSPNSSWTSLNNAGMRIYMEWNTSTNSTATLNVYPYVLHPKAD